MLPRITAGLLIAIALSAATGARGESRQEYQNKVRLMLDFAVRTNEYVRQRLGDKGLARYAQGMAEQNAREAERMTPPPQLAVLHPHVLLVLENIERGFHFAAAGDLGRYRHHQKIVRKELQLLETFAEEERLELYLWRKGL